MDEFPNALFTFNGHHFRFDGFVRQIKVAVTSVKIYETNTGRKPNRNVQKQVLKAVAQRLLEDEE